jgi:hypothetical protein
MTEWFSRVYAVMCTFRYLSLQMSLILLGFAGIAPNASSGQNSDTIYATPGP